LICFVGPKMPGSSRLIELIGTLLILLPAGIDLLRKYYVKRRTPSSPDTEWARTLKVQAFLGFEGLYAWAVFWGFSMIASGFAMDFFRGA